MPRVLQGINTAGRILAPLLNFIRQAPSLLNEYEEITTSATPAAMDVTVYQTWVTSDTTAGRSITIGNGSNAIIGQQKVVKFVTKNGSGTFIISDVANLVKADNVAAVTSLTFTTAGHYALLEWTGAKWRIVYTTATLV